MLSTNRQPNQADLLSLAKALNEFNVEYVIIGGAAMALHGFPRMTKDIDLLLPLDPANNERLLCALESMPENKEARAVLRLEWMNKGHSTALEGEIYIDLLYMAASKSFEELRGHVQTVLVNGFPVVTLDVDGMLLTKQTTRETDIPDRLKLGRLKSAMRELALKEQVERGDPPSVVSTGAFSGKILNIVDGVASQKINRSGLTVLHLLSSLSKPVCIGDVVDIRYVRGLGIVDVRKTPEVGG